MTEWIEQEDWSTVQVGDQVRVTRDGQKLTGGVLYAFRRTSMLGVIGDVEHIDLDCAFLSDYATVGRGDWTLWVPAKPAVVLPTAVGFYSSRTGGIWEIGHPERGLISLNNPGMCPEPEEFAPFTRLEPVAETAKKVLDDVSKFAWADGFMPQLRTLGIKYGSIDE